MHKLIDECITRLDSALQEVVNSGKEVNLRETMVNYTMDVIALTAFATKINAHISGEEKHPFVKNSQVFFRPSLRIISYFLLNATMPSLVKKTGFSFMPKSVFDYFANTVSLVCILRLLILVLYHSCGQ
jgi:hypothetical protein